MRNKSKSRHEQDYPAKYCLRPDGCEDGIEVYEDIYIDPPMTPQERKEAWAVGLFLLTVIVVVAGLLCVLAWWVALSL